MARIGTLAINVVANTSRFTTGLRTASRQVMGFTGVISKSMRVLSPFSTLFGAGLVFGGAAAFIGAGKSANDFAGTMNRSLAIMQDVGPKMRAEMELTAHSVAASTQFTAKETARAFFFLASAGMDAQASMASLNQVALFGQAGNFDLATATDLATDAQSAMGLKSKDAAKNLANLTRVTDALTGANTLGNASVQQFSETLTNKAGAAARMYGLSLEQTLGMAVAFADQGVKGAEAGTRMGIVLRDLTTKSIENAEAFKKAGISVWKYGELMPPAEIFKGIEAAMVGMNGEARKTLLMNLKFSDKSVAATQALIGYSGAMADATDELMKMGGMTKEVADSSLTDFDKAWNKIAASMGKASTEAFTPIMEQMAEMSGAIDPATMAVEDLANASGKVETIWSRIGSEVAKTLAEIKQIDIESAQEQTDVFNALKGLSGTAGALDPQASLGVPAPSRGVPRDQQLKAWRRRQLFDADRMQLPEPFTGKEKEANRIAEEKANRIAEEKAVAAGKRIEESGKSLSEALDKVAAETSHKRFERDKARDIAAQRLVVQTRTAGEEFVDTLIDLDRLLKSGVPGIGTAAMRKAAEAKTEFLGPGEREPERFTPGLTPALEAGSVAAAEAIARSMQTSFPVRAAESTAANTAKVAQLTPLMVKLLEKINGKVGQPGTVEAPSS